MMHEAETGILNKDCCVVYLPGLDGSGLLSGSFLPHAEVLLPLTQLHYPPRLRLTLEEMANGCVHALLEQGKRSAVWLGDSFGSALALTIALRHPQAVQGLILAGGMTRYPSTSRLYWQASLLERLPDYFANRYLKARINNTLGFPINGTLKSMLGQDSQGTREDFAWRLKLLATFNIREYLPQINVPTLYLGGEEDRFVDTHEEARLIRTHIPVSRTFLFPECGHCILADRPEACRDLIISNIPLATREAA